MIILLHGFDSSAERSSSVTTLTSTLTALGETVVPVSYDYLNPEVAEKQIQAAIVEDEPLVFIGNSLGGFWARHFANKYPTSQLIMINPSITAHTNVEKYVGKKDRLGNMIPVDIGERLKPYYVKEDHPSLSITVIVGLKDEVVPPEPTLTLYEGRAHIIVKENGEHRLPMDNTTQQEIITALNLLAE
jgi:predicted esterase YcpF (UPF0227 family)